MRHYQDYKKQFLNIIYLSLFLLVSCFLIVSAETADEVKNKIDQKNDEITQIEEQIKEYQKSLAALGKQKSTLSNVIKELDLTKKKLTADISLTTKKIDKTNLRINDLTSQIGSKEISISKHAKALTLDIKSLDEFERKTLVENILQNKNISDIWNDVDSMATLRKAIVGQIDDLKIIKGNLETTRTETVKAKAELIALQSKLSDQKKIIEENTREKNALLKETKNSEATYQKILKDKTAKKAALEKELRDYESQLKFILDPSKLPTSGVLAWPLDDVYVTQLFGKTVDSKRLYASGSHSGVDFRATVGTPVKAMAAGVVKGVGDTDTTCAGASFGKWVFIEYDDGLSSTFGHLSLIKATPGERVQRGDVVAYSGATGHVTGPHLHVTVYAGGAASVKTVPSKACVGKTLTQPLAATNAYLDPMYYLPPYKK
jgi:murein DD-endopeptidase MepM/ murein hydrolase activator NlpD